jgi:hypothetical protein
LNRSLLEVSDEVLDDDLLCRKYDGKLPECAICLEYFQVGEMVWTIPCFHLFHKACIDPWLATKAICPVYANTLQFHEMIVHFFTALMTYMGSPELAF